MKKAVQVFLTFVIFCSFSVRAADTLVIEPNNSSNEGFLNIMLNDAGAHVYKLKRGGIYKIFGPDVLSNSFPLTIVGEDIPEDIRPALIVYFDTNDGSKPSSIIEANNNVTLKNLYLTGVVSPDFDNPVNGYSRMINFYASKKDSLKLTVENCVCNYTNTWRGFFYFASKYGSVQLKNNMIMNMMREDGYLWASFMDLNERKDSVIVINNTFFNCPFVFAKKERQETFANYFLFEHNTVVNSALCFYPFSYSINLHCRNNIFFNTQFLGDMVTTAYPWPNYDLVYCVDFEPHAMIRVDTINNRELEDSMCSFLNIPYRTVEYTNNCIYQTEKVKSLADEIAGDSCKIAQVLSPRSQAMFADNANFPGFVFEKNYFENPDFTKNPSNEDKLLVYAKNLYRKGVAESNFIFDPDNNPATFEWPVIGKHINLCFAKSNVMIGSNSNLPIGDYYHWFKKNNPTECIGEQTGTNKVVPIINLAMYPNPCSDVVKFKFIAEMQEPVKFEIFNITGKLIKTETIEAVKGENNYYFNLKNLPTGVYCCVYSLGSRKVGTAKFSKF